MSFLAATTDWFLGKRASHMGVEQYVGHAGTRNGRSTSGALLWAMAEAERNAAAGNMVNAETYLLRRVAQEISSYVPIGTTVVDLGPGTSAAFKNKTLPIAHKLESKECALVDESVAFLRQIIEAGEFRGSIRIRPILDDFFENESSYLDGSALICSFGSTISNIINPVSVQLPRKALVKSLLSMAQAADSGWLLVGFDSDQDGEHVSNYFTKHALFQLNIFDRMAAELPLKGAFDPLAFDYEPQWIASSGQLAHIAVVNKDMRFTLGDTPISLGRGQRLHIKNSYKFVPEFFESCCADAGLEVIKTWTDHSTAKIYLMKMMPRIIGQEIESAVFKQVA